MSKEAKYSKEEVVNYYMYLHKKLERTPSTNDIKTEHNKNKEFPSIYHFIKYFKNMTFLAKQCGLVPNESYYMNNPEGFLKEDMCSDEEIMLKYNNNLRQFLRSACIQWRKDSLDKWNGRSCISGKQSKIIHHDYPFFKILTEMFEITKLKTSNNTNNYNKEELDEMKRVCLKLHYKYGMGYCLTSSEHKEFHKIYGYDNCENKIAEFIKLKQEKNYENKENRFNFNNCNIVVSKSEMDEIVYLKEISNKHKYILFAFFVT